MPRKLTAEQALVLRQKRDTQDPCLHYTAPVTLQRASECKARYICAHAPNQCLGYNSEVYDPVAKISRKVGEIVDSFHVYAWDEHKGKMVVAKALAPEQLEKDEIWRVTLSNGLSFEASLGHRLLCADGIWRRIADVTASCSLYLPPSTLGNGQPIHVADGLRSTGIAQGSLGEPQQSALESVQTSSYDCLLVTSLEYVRADYKYDFEVPQYHNYLIAGSISHNCGKTAWMQYITTSILRNKNPHWKYTSPVKILLIVPKRAQAAEVWGNRLLKACELFGPLGRFPWIPNREILKVYNSYSPAGPYPGKIVMKNGSEMMTILSGDPNSWKALEGMTFDLVIRDEVAGNEGLGDEIQPRLLASRTRALAGLQPWGGVMIWSATETKHNDEWLAFKQRCIDGVADHAYFKPQPEEASAYISMKARQEMSGSMSAKSYRIRGLGTLDAGDLVCVFGQQWDDKRHVLAQDYVVQPDDNLHAAYDPGVLMTGLIIGAVNKHRPSQIKIVKVFEHTNETTEFDADCLHSFLLGRKLASLVYDWAAKATNKNGSPSVLHSLIAALDARGIQPMAGYIPADKRVDEGINTMRHYLDPNSFDKTVEPLFVINPSQESGCPMLRSEIMGYRSTEPTPNSPGKIVKKNDHTTDCARYLCRVMPYWSSAYCCGPAKFAVERPLESSPYRLSTSNTPKTPMELRAELSRQLGVRNKASIRKMFVPKR